MKKLVVFDLDSTLLDGESINTVLEQTITSHDLLNELEVIRAEAMQGKRALSDSLRQRVALLKGLKLQNLQDICQTIPWIHGAKETIQHFKKNGYITICLSGSFRTVTRRTIIELGMDAYCCNTLEHRNNVLTGEISGALMSHESKGFVLKKIQKALSISPQNTIAVGDGANDLSMFSYADTSIAFCMNDELSKKARHTIKDKNLLLVLDFI